MSLLLELQSMNLPRKPQGRTEGQGQCGAAHPGLSGPNIGSREAVVRGRESLPHSSLLFRGSVLMERLG